MLFKLKPRNKSLAEKEIGRLLLELEKLKPGSPEYVSIVESIEKLNGLKRVNNESFQKVAPTVIGVVGNIGGVLLMMNYERLHVITTKALGMAYKPKII